MIANAVTAAGCAVVAFLALAAGVVIGVPDEDQPTVREIAVGSWHRSAARRWAGRLRILAVNAAHVLADDLAPPAVAVLRPAARVVTLPALPRPGGLAGLEAPALAGMPPAQNCPGSLYPSWPLGAFAAAVAAGEHDPHP